MGKKPCTPCERSPAALKVSPESFISKQASYEELRNHEAKEDFIYQFMFIELFI